MGGRCYIVFLGTYYKSGYKMRYLLLGLLLVTTNLHATEGVTAFGEIEVSEPTPIFQATAVYGIHESLLALTGGNGVASTSGSNFLVTSGTATSNSFGFIGSRHPVNYRAGQGMLGRLTAVYGEPQTGNRQLWRR